MIIPFQGATGIKMENREQRYLGWFFAPNTSLVELTPWLALASPAASMPSLPDADMLIFYKQHKSNCKHKMLQKKE